MPFKNTDEKNQYLRSRYAWLKSHSICTQCGSADASVGSNLCPDCWEKKEACRKEITEEQKAQQAEYMKVKRQTRINLGLCVQCGEPLDQDKTRCKKCAKKHNESQKRRRPKSKTYNELIYLGICVRCRKNKSSNGKTICAECRDYLYNTWTYKGEKRGEAWRDKKEVAK